MTVLQLDPAPSNGLPMAEWPTNYVVGRHGAYAHIPRSAVQWGVPGLAGFRRVVLGWCGVMLHGALSTDEPGELPVCGTCFGRAEAQTTADLAFMPCLAVNVWSPRRRWCPGMTVQGERWNRGSCALCGYEGKLTSKGGIYNSSYSIARHEPQSEAPLVFCPQHGIDRLSHDQEAVWCLSWQCTFRRELR